jgi:hypothetical protein
MIPMSAMITEVQGTRERMETFRLATDRNSNR